MAPPSVQPPEPRPGDGSWTTVIAVVADDDNSSALVCDVLWQYGPAAIEERDRPHQRVLLAGYATASQATAAAAAVEPLVVEPPRLEAVVDDGLDGWRAWARVESAGPFRIRPTWLADPAPRSAAADADAITLSLDPGR